MIGCRSPHAAPLPVSQPGAGNGFRRLAGHGRLADDAPCTTQGLLEAVANLVDPSDWSTMVDEVRRSVCVNRYAGWKYDCVFATFPLTATVCTVLVAYMNMAYDRRIPEYKPGANPATGEGSPYWPAYDGSVAVGKVAKLTGTGVTLVQEILFELYWATASGRVTGSQYIAPWTYRLNKETLTTNPENTDTGKNRGFFDFQFVDILRWGLILAAVGVGAYIVSGVVTGVHSVSTALKHHD